MWLDRSLIKQQAKELIKNRVLKLFGVTFIILLIINACGTVYNITSYDNIFDTYNDYGGYEDYFNENFGEDSNSYADDFNNFDNSGSSEYEDNFNNFGTDGGSEDYADNFNSFGGRITLPAAADAQTAAPGGFSVNYTLNILSFAFTIASILLSALSVSLTYFYVEYVTGKEFEFDSGLKSVFHNAFKVTYLKKVGVWLLRGILTVLLMVLFIVPGIVFNYSSYFAYEIMSEYPELSPWQAIKLSKKIIKGYRTELFVLDLSFIPWFLLCVFIFPVIYVWPYMFTTKALYYENFKMRALAMNMITEDDFLSDAQKMSKAMNGGAQYQQQPYGNNYSQPQGAPYYQNAPYQQYNGGNYYNAPGQQPQQNTQNGTQQNYQPGQNEGYYQPQQGGAPYGNNYSEPQQSAPYYQNAPYQQGGYSQPYGSAVRPVYFTPVMPAQREEEARRKIMEEMNRTTPNGNGAQYQQNANYAQTPNSQGENTAQPQTETQATQPAEEKRPEAPDITITPPQEPTEPEYAEPKEPVENFTEPQEPEDAQEPTETEQTEDPKNEE